MEKIYRYRDLKTEASRDVVLKCMDCEPGNPVYEEACEEYDVVAQEFENRISAVASCAFVEAGDELTQYGIPRGSQLLCVVRSIGFSASAVSGEYFAQGDYLKGMIADKLADQLLFSIERSLNPLILQVCREKGFGVHARYDPPQQVPMQVQKLIYQATKVHDSFQFELSSGFMIDPQKSCSSLYVLTGDTAENMLEHDCRRCDNMTCKMRSTPKVSVTMEDGTKFVPEKGESLLLSMQRNQIYLSAPCGGAGRCGKCAIQLIKGELPITERDGHFFSEEKLREGYRLACAAYPEGEIQIRIPGKGEEQFEVAGTQKTVKKPASDHIGIAIDIGTTTVTVSLVNKETAETVASSSFVNQQRAFGADVISRQQASIDGKRTELAESIRRQLADGIRDVLAQSGAKAEKVENVVIGANTTMVHLLMGWPCDGLGVFPFTAYELSAVSVKFGDLFGNTLLDCPVTVLPGISTYVGGDIVAGLLETKMAESDKPVFLLDLGTNGEMALGDRNGILCTSTAAGPAFEGGNISCGTGSIPGAICSVVIAEEKAVCHTIGEQEPCGICGTGVVETTAELVKNELVDETGRLEDPYFSEGFPLATGQNGSSITFTQKDVREIQLAKAAVRAGVETLLLRAGVSYDDIGAVYLAGGFGYRIDKEKAAEIGMLPSELIGKTTAIGNSSLSGAVKVLCNQELLQAASKLAESAKEIPLSTDKDFNRIYMEAMYFDGE